MKSRFQQLLIVPLLMAPTIARAVDGSDVGLGTANPKQVAVNIVSLAISYVPFVALIMLIIGGLMWMTSAGDEEKVRRAKVTISATLVGMVIIMISWAIVYFVLGVARNVTR